MEINEQRNVQTQTPLLQRVGDHVSISSTQPSASTQTISRMESLAEESSCCTPFFDFLYDLAYAVYDWVRSFCADDLASDAELRGATNTLRATFLSGETLTQTWTYESIDAELNGVHRQIVFPANTNLLFQLSPEDFAIFQEGGAVPTFDSLVSILETALQKKLHCQTGLCQLIVHFGPLSNSIKLICSVPVMMRVKNEADLV